MSRKIVVQVSAPAVVIGLLLFLVCVLSAWHISRQQRDLARVLSREVNSLQAAQELEIRIRQLRFHSFLNLVDPSHAREEPILKAHAGVEEALERARQAANSPEEEVYLQAIGTGYGRYKEELAELPAELLRLGPNPDLHKLMDGHPVRHVADPAQDLLLLTKQQMEQTVQEGEGVSRLVRLAMLGLGVVGPLSGLIGGYGIARGLSRSIYQLSVRVQDIARHLDHEVASVSIPAAGDLQQLDRRLQYIVNRVEEVTRDAHRHQRDLLRAEQLAAVGQLAASVAHEVRNPLTSVKLLVEGALRPADRIPLDDEALQVIHGEVVRLEQTVQGFLHFARPPALERSAADLREVVAHAAELVRARARQQDVALDLDSGEAPVIAEVDRGQLCTVVLNLFLNALDAMPHGGQLRVTLRATGAGCLLEVRDTGPGIAAEIVGRLFTPFASTKPTGTGLGLSVCKRVVEEHGGTIAAANLPAGGACFTMTLPALREPAHVHVAGD